MKKVILSLSMLAGSLSAMAEDYPYLTFETANGTKTSISTSSLTISIQDGKLMAGSMELTLADLSKMYFSTSDETTGISEELIVNSDELATAIYDLNGRQVQKDQMRSGQVYIVKTKSGIRKIAMK